MTNLTDPRILAGASAAAAVTGAVAAAAVSGYFARDAREYARAQLENAKHHMRALVDLMLDAADPQREAQPQPQRPELRVIRGGAS